MARTTPHYRYDSKLRVPRAATPLECKDDKPVCPACKGLECLCRPRFFAGQLLTEQDLNRLDHYVRAKSRLHNRHLHGWGVVCGLEVSCDGCGDGVRVSGGYALDPCGNDVVVCNDEIVDVCALIEECRQRDHESLCQEPVHKNDDCKEREEDWVLAIRYQETPSRGITPLRGAGCSTCGTATKSCSCGGSRGAGGCGCGSGGKAKKGATGAAACSCSATSTARPRNASAECEPTITCESYAFEVYKVPKPVKPDRPGKTPVLGGTLVERFLCCWQGFIDALMEPPGDFNRNSYAETPRAWADWLADSRDALLIFYSRYPGYNCDTIQRLRCLTIPNANSDGFADRFDAIVPSFALLVIEQLFACICSALLPPCPKPAVDDRIPLAVVTVRRSPCQVVRVCNWTPLRKVLVTLPNILYWLSVIPLAEPLRDVLHQMCCELFGLRDRFDTREVRREVRSEVRNDVVNRPATATISNKKQSDQLKAFVSLGATAFGGARTGIHPMGVMASVLGVATADKEGLLDDLQLTNPLHHFAMSQLGRSLLDGAGLDRKQPRSGGANEVAGALRALEARVEAQAREIEELRRRVSAGDDQ